MGRQANTLAAQQMQHGSTHTRLEEKLKDNRCNMYQHARKIDHNFIQFLEVSIAEKREP